MAIKIFISCKYKMKCYINRYNYFKNKQKYSIYYHTNNDFDYGFLASLVLHTEKAYLAKEKDNDEIDFEGNSKIEKPLSPRRSKQQRVTIKKGSN